MIIKIGDRFLDFDGDIDIERQIKLFDDISTIDGDYSYSFTLPVTANNIDILGINGLNALNYWNRRIDCQLLSDSGEILYVGFLRIETSDKREIRVNFFSGNSDWFQLLETNIRNYNFSRYDKETTSAGIVSSWSLDSGIVWPFINRGGLLTRKIGYYYDQDFQPFIYVKDVVNSVLAQEGIKLEGDLESDALYNSLITTNNGLGGVQANIDAQSTYIGKSSNQTINENTLTSITFTDTNTPYEQSTYSNWDTTNSRYTFTENVLKFEVSYSIKIEQPSTVLSSISVRIYVNGTLYDKQVLSLNQITRTITKTVDSTDFNTVTRLGGFATGEYVEIKMQYSDIAGSGTIDVLTGSWVKVKPTKFNKVYASSLLPDVKANEFIPSIFKLFNGFCSYNPISKVLTVKKLDNILRAEPVDISEYIELNDINYTEFVDSYSQINNFLYQAQDFDEQTRYDQENVIPYGGGQITIDNEFLDESNDLLELDFISGWQQDVDFLSSLPRFDYVEMVENDVTKSITSVTDNGDGYARFNFSGSNDFAGTLVRVSLSTIDEYNGDHEILINAASYVVLRDVVYLGDATCTITELEWEDLDNDEQALLINRPSTKLTDIGNSDIIYGPDSNDYDTIGLAYFYYPNNGTNLGNKRNISLSWGTPQNSNQKGLLDIYYKSTQNLLNNGTLLNVTAYLPEFVFKQIDFLRPVRIKKEQVNGLFLVNSITGYQGNGRPCEMELISIQNNQVETGGTVQTPDEEGSTPVTPPTTTVRYYLADLYNCSTCALVLSAQVVEYESIGQLRFNKWYNAEGIYAAYIYALGSAPSDYTLVSDTVYASCADVPCVSP